MFSIQRPIRFYLIALLLLLGLAALASMSLLRFIEGFFLTPGASTQTAEQLEQITWVLLAFTMGFFFLAGAFGIWAIRSAGRIEAQRSMGRLVDALTHLPDGVVIVNPRGRITGMNPMARALASSTAGNTLKDYFPALTEDQEARLLSRDRPEEVECSVSKDGRTYILRFRSQNIGESQLIFISDITEQKTEDARRRQAALLQVIGRIAQGVAHDFNNILCAVSGHAQLLLRDSPKELVEGLEAIGIASQRGASLAAHLLRLTRASHEGPACAQPLETIRRAAELVEAGIGKTWEIEVDVAGEAPPTLLTEAQVEQLVVSFALLLADRNPQAKKLHICARAAGNRHSAFDVGPQFSTCIWIGQEKPDSFPEKFEHIDDETGLIYSVARSLLTEVGGRLDRYRKESRIAYRLCLPALPATRNATAVPSSLDRSALRDVSGWCVIVAAPPEEATEFCLKALRSLNADVKAATDLVTLLDHVEKTDSLDLLLVHEHVLGSDAEAILRAIRKLRPKAEIVIMRSPEAAGKAMPGVEIIEWPISESLLSETLMRVARSRAAKK